MRDKATSLLLLTTLCTTLFLGNSTASADQAAYIQELNESAMEDGWGSRGTRHGGDDNGARRGGDDNVAVPEPGTVALLGLGLASLKMLRRPKQS